MTCIAFDSVPCSVCALITWKNGEILSGMTSYNTQRKETCTWVEITSYNVGGDLITGPPVLLQ